MALSSENHLLIADLPGADLVVEGLKDAAAGRVTPNACLVFIASPRLRAAGLLDMEALPIRILDAELKLYDLLCEEPGDAYGAYNSLLRRLVSFERALDHRLTAQRKAVVGSNV